MFLRCTTRKKMARSTAIGIWSKTAASLVARWCSGRCFILERSDDSQCEVWRKSIEVFEDGRSAPRTVALFAEEQTAPIDDEQVIQVRLKDLSRLSQFLTRNPRKWLMLSIRYSANGLRLSPQIDFDRGRFGVVVALVKTSPETMEDQLSRRLGLSDAREANLAAWTQIKPDLDHQDLLESVQDLSGR